MEFKKVYLDSDLIPFVIFDLIRLLPTAEEAEYVAKLPPDLASDMEFLHYADEKWENHRPFISRLFETAKELEGDGVVIWICPHCGGTQYNVYPTEEPECDHACTKPIEWKDVYQIVLNKDEATGSVPWDQMVNK